MLVLNRPIWKKITKKSFLSRSQNNNTLWGNDSESFNDFGQPVVLLKNGSLSEFNGGKLVPLGSGSSLKINPDCGGGESITTSISARSVDGGTLAVEWLTFPEAQLKYLGNGEDPVLDHIVREFEPEF